MTPQDVITTARYLYNDSESSAVLQRKLDAELLGYVNDGIKEVSLLMPNLFYSVGDLLCSAGDSEQVLSFSDVQTLVDVIGINGGENLIPFDWDTMSQFRPGWRYDTASAAKQWCRKQGDPLRFYIWPPAPANQYIEVLYVRTPLTYTLTDPITELPGSFVTPLADYVVYRAESADDEHSNSGRATAAYQAFVGKIKGA